MTGVVSASEIDGLAARVQGPVLRAGDSGYDTERAGFQTAFPHRPAVVVGATGAGDVRAAVELAAGHRLPIAVQATGHGLSVPLDGGVLISTRRMSGVRIDPAARTAWIEAGVRWGKVIEAAAGYGLGTLSGSAPHVGCVSYMLGGGIGLLGREFGYTADRVRAIDVVTADGRIRHVTAQRDADLFWALRGARQNFGVVTAVEVDLEPMTRVYGGGRYLPAELAGEFVPAYLKWTAAVPETVTSSISVIAMPDLPMIPEPIRGRRVIHFRMAYTGDAASGDHLVAPLRAIGPALIDEVGEMPFTSVGSIYSDPTMPHGYVGTSVMLRDLTGSQAVDLLAVAADAPVQCIVDIRHMGGAFRRAPEVGNCVGHRDAEYLLRILTPVRPGETAGVRELHERMYEPLAPARLGRCLNFSYGEDTTPEQVATFYDPDDYRRLRELKAVYDRADVFKLHHHIPPAG